LLITGGVVWEGGRVLVGENLHVVVPGQVYRGAQRSPEQLEKIVQRFGIRTVVNLRGLANPSPWYLDQSRKIQQLGISQQDLSMSASRLPPAQEIRRLVDIIDNADYPIYFHCRRGADRTGVASVIARLLRTQCSYEEARGQLHWRYGHIPYSRLASMDEFFDLYTGWLEKHSRQHDEAAFRHWLLHEYHGCCDYEVDEFHRIPAVQSFPAYVHQPSLPPPSPLHISPQGQRGRVEALRPLSQWERGEGEANCVACEVPIAYAVRLRNTGVKTWHITTHSRAGFHLGYRVWDLSGKMMLEGRCCAREEEIPPGAVFAGTVVVPGQLPPGRYRIMIDLIEETLAWSFQTGSEPMEGELDVCE
jgi:protein tyrosine phosphatase (PTP) superfamily phosphohydrolase (DUF442 family)